MNVTQINTVTLLTHSVCLFTGKKRNQMHIGERANTVCLLKSLVCLDFLSLNELI